MALTIGTKRFTPLCHFVLGLGLALAPIGGYIAVSGSFATVPLLFSVAVFLWVSGFDIIYSLQDDSFDRVFANLSSVLESESFTHLEPGNFQYIDLRFGNKVFVNEELGVATSTESELGSSTVTAGESASTTR